MAARSFDSIHRRRVTSQARQQLLARYHQGQFSQGEFATRHGLGLSMLVKWLQQERATGQPPVSFEEVVLPNVSSGWAVEVVSPQGWTVRLQRAGDLASLAPVLRALPC